MKGRGLSWGGGVGLEVWSLGQSVIECLGLDDCGYTLILRLSLGHASRHLKFHTACGRLPQEHPGCGCHHITSI